MSHRLGFLFSSLILSAIAVPASAQIPPIRTVDPATGHTYELSQTAELWNIANAQSQTLVVDGYQGYFATINNQAENDFVLRFWQPFTNTVWIGLTDQTTEGSFGWANGEPVNYTNWSVGEPNGSVTENYTQMFATGLWNDLPNGQLNYIVEFNTVLPPPPDVPEPGTVALATAMATFGAFCLHRRRQRRK